jgi:hypothetical protein
VTLSSTGVLSAVGVRRALAPVLTPARAWSTGRCRTAMDRQLAEQPPRADCPVCAAPGVWAWRPVIWPVLAAQWRLSRRERAVLDVQQGHVCTRCGQSLRSRALARAVLDVVGAVPPLAAGLAAAGPLRLLEVNPAGGLSGYLAAAAAVTVTGYPEVDMQRLPYPDGSFDLVVHSDTLEHVPDAVLGMRECLRVAGSGWVVFTTPVLAGRRTRRRRGIVRSYHGGDTGRALVHHEFGADIWAILAEAGATEVRLHLDEHPYAVAISCRARRASG